MLEATDVKIGGPRSGSPSLTVSSPGVTPQSETLGDGTRPHHLLRKASETFRVIQRTLQSEAPSQQSDQPGSLQREHRLIKLSGASAVESFFRMLVAPVLGPIQNRGGCRGGARFVSAQLSFEL